MAIYRKECMQAAKGCPLPRIDSDGRLIPEKAIYDVLCDQIADLVADDTLAVGSMAYVREEIYHTQVKVADDGETTDWEALDAEPAADDTEEVEET